jgi:hypothetical protein
MHRQQVEIIDYVPPSQSWTEWFTESSWMDRAKLGLKVAAASIFVAPFVGITIPTGLLVGSLMGWGYVDNRERAVTYNNKTYYIPEIDPQDTQALEKLFVACKKIIKENKIGQEGIETFLNKAKYNTLSNAWQFSGKVSQWYKEMRSRFSDSNEYARLVSDDVRTLERHLTDVCVNSNKPHDITPTTLKDNFIAQLKDGKETYTPYAPLKLENALDLKMNAINEEEELSQEVNNAEKSQSGNESLRKKMYEQKQRQNVKELSNSKDLEFSQIGNKLNKSIVVSDLLINTDKQPLTGGQNDELNNIRQSQANNQVKTEEYFYEGSKTLNSRDLKKYQTINNIDNNNNEDKKFTPQTDNTQSINFSEFQEDKKNGRMLKPYQEQTQKPTAQNNQLFNSTQVNGTFQKGGASKK